MSDLPTSASPTAPVPHGTATRHRRWPRSRIAFLAGVLVLALVALVTTLVVATRDHDDTPEQAATTTTTTVEAITTETTTAQSTTTLASTTTTTAPTTTTTLTPAPVTVGPTYPTALGRHLVPWNQIDDGWTLVVYDGCSGAEANDPAVVYLVDPVGTRYEITTLPMQDRLPGAPCWPQQHLLDWAVEGDVALLGQSCCDSTVLELLDLRSGDRTELVTTSIGSAGLTRPTGAQLVVSGMVGDDATWRIARYDRLGHALVVFEEASSTDTGWIPHHDAWLYTDDGTALVLGGGWTDDAPGLEVVGNDGSWRRPLDTPGLRCTPLRWWDPTTALVRCHVTGTSGLESLWLVPLDGTPASPVAEPGPDCPGLCGLVDAWPAGDALVLRRIGAQGESRLERAAADGGVTVLPIGGAPVGLDTLRVHDGRILVVVRDLGTSRAELVGTAADGTDARVLVPATGGTHGVCSAAAGATGTVRAW